jgi:hypothetical protein
MAEFGAVKYEARLANLKTKMRSNLFQELGGGIRGQIEHWAKLPEFIKQAFLNNIAVSVGPSRCS